MTPDPNATPAETQGGPAEGASGAEDGSQRTSWIDSLPQEQAAYIRQLRQEAANYRTERNQHRDEAAQLRERVDSHDRQRIERLAAERLHDPRDFLDRLGDLAELRGEDGLLSEQAVTERLEALVTERPHLALPAPGQAIRDSAGARGTRTHSGEPQFGEALKNIQRRR